MVISFIMKRYPIVASVPAMDKNSWSPAGIQGQLLTQGLEPRSYSQRAVFSAHYNTLLALSFSTFRSSTLGQKTWS